MMTLLQIFRRGVAGWAFRVMTLATLLTASTSAAAQTGPQRAVETLSARANLLRWATLTPDLGVEWRVRPDIALAVEAAYTSWSWDDKQRRYGLWEIAPEVRWCPEGWRGAYVGAMYKAGAFNYQLSAEGKQGNLQGLGLTGGYRLRLDRRWSLDFTLALGWLHAHYDRYYIDNGRRLRLGSHQRSNYFGPINAGVTLVWTIL